MKLVRRRIGGRERGGKRGGGQHRWGGGGGCKVKQRRYARLEILLGCTERDRGGEEKQRMKGTSGKMIKIIWNINTRSLSSLSQSRSFVNFLSDTITMQGVCVSFFHCLF